MANRSGGIKNIREVNETVYFHPENAKEMFNYLSPHLSGFCDCKDCSTHINILDACSGTGILGKALGSLFNGASINFVDINQNKNIFDVKEKYDFIVCNPPWSLKISLPIYWHLINNCLKKHGILFFIINNVFCYQGSDRAETLKYQKYYFLPRWTFKHANRPLLDCGVMVCYKDPELIPFDASELTPYIPLTRQYK